MYTSYFGKPDAAKENRSRLYPEFFDDFLSQIKNESNSELPYIISGIRGSGKTALRMILQSQKEKERKIVITLDKEYVIPSINYRNSPSLYLHLVANWILIQIHNKLIISKKFHSDVGMQSSLRIISNKVKETLGSLIRGAKAKTPIIEIDFDKLKSGIPADVSRLKINFYLTEYRKIQNFPPVYVLIDDFETIFEGASEDDNILYNSLSAIGEINESFEELINIIVFPNLVLERKFVAKSLEGQKYREKVIEISWSTQKLTRLISLRIAQRKKISKRLSDLQLWAKEFYNAIDAIERLPEMNISGPRDIVELANMANKKAKNAKISPEDIDDVLIKFAKRKFEDINRDYGLMYSEIGDILKRLFLEDIDFSTRKSLKSSTKVFKVNLKASETFSIPENWKWFWDLRFDELLEILYRTSAMGVRSGNETIYFKHDPSRDLNNDDAFTPHPLFKFWADEQDVDEK
jgi:hypothetical protein